ncbi:MAG: hypothetical protein AAFU65_11820 [Pseudomonadota bacterium]
MALTCSAVLAGCASTAPTTGESFETRQAKANAGAQVSIEELAESTPVSDEALAAALADDFWSNGTVASLDDSGNLVYTTEGDIVADPNYNRTQLQSLRANNVGQRLIYDPITGRPIWVSRRGTAFIGNPRGNVIRPIPTGGSSSSGLEPAPRIRVSPGPSRSAAPAPTRPASRGRSSDSRR